MHIERSGKFSVHSREGCKKRAEAAMSELFQVQQNQPEENKKKAISLLREPVFEIESKAVENEKENLCSNKLLVKDHKCGYSFRVVVNKNGTWQNKLFPLFSRKPFRI